MNSRFSVESHASHAIQFFVTLYPSVFPSILTDFEDGFPVFSRLDEKTGQCSIWMDNPSIYPSF